MRKFLVASPNTLPPCSGALTRPDRCCFFLRGRLCPSAPGRLPEVAGDGEASPFLEFSPPYRASLWFQAAETKRFEIGRSSGGAGICKSCWTTADKYGKEGGSRWGQSVSYLEKYKQFHPGFGAKSIFKWVIASSTVFILFLRCWVWSHLFSSFKITSIKHPVLTLLHPDVWVKMVFY